jgi:hypothetical protein
MARLQAEDNFYATTAQPELEDLINWVQLQPVYKGKWTNDELTVAGTLPSGEPREMLGVEDVQALNKTDVEQKYSEIWNIYSWLKPNNISITELKRDMAKNDPTYNEDNWTLLFSGADVNAWRDPAEFEHFYQSITESASRLGVQSPEGADLGLYVKAEQLNKELDAILEQYLGTEYKDYVNTYYGGSSRDQSAYRIQHKDEYDIIKMYNQLRNTFAKQNPIWAQVYKPDAMPRAIPTITQTQAQLEQNLSPKKLASDAVPNMPSFSEEFWDKTSMGIRKEIYDYGNFDVPLSKAAKDFLNLMAERYPDWAGEINRLLTK